MTHEQYKLAHKYIHDLETLEEVKYAQDKQYWVAFVTGDYPNKRLDIYSSIFIDDFKVFVDAEIKKLEKCLEEL